MALVSYFYLWLPGCYLETVTSVEHTPEATDKPVNTVLCLGGLTCSFQSLFPFPSLVFLPGGVVQASGAGTLFLIWGWWLQTRRSGLKTRHSLSESSHHLSCRAKPCSVGPSSHRSLAFEQGLSLGETLAQEAWLARKQCCVLRSPSSTWGWEQLRHTPPNLSFAGHSEMRIKLVLGRTDDSVMSGIGQRNQRDLRGDKIPTWGKRS